MSMLKQVFIPVDLGPSEIRITAVHVAKGDRIRRNQMLIEVLAAGVKRSVNSAHDGWVSIVYVKAEQLVRAGDLMLVVDVVGDADYRPDSAEVNPHVELGEAGRRGAERQKQKEFGKGFGADLFDALEQKQGFGRGLPQNPLMRNMKEGVPPKMQSSAANNPQAIDEAVKDAPELKMSPQLQQQLQISESPSMAPRPSPTK